jgi:hypothetical protein
MKQIRIALVFSVLALGFMPAAAIASTCSVKDKVPSSARIFAKANDQSDWREYANAGEVPELGLDSGVTAQFVQRKKESPSVTIVKPGEEYSTYTRYCYGEDGGLAGVSFEMRTQLGWGYRMEGTASASGFSANSHEFFRTKDGKPIAHPDGVADAPADLQPTLYMKLGDLPFAALLKTATTSTKTHSGRHAGMALVSAAN